MPSAGCTPTAASAGSTRCAIPRATEVIGTYAMGESRPDRAEDVAGETMVQTYRLARGGRIDRSKPIAMRFNGKELEAFAGDTVGLGASRQRHPLRRPVVQVSPPARDLQPRRRGAECAAVGRSRRRPHRSEQPRVRHRSGGRPVAPLAEPLAVASASTSARSTTRCRRFSSPASTTRPSCGRRSFWDRVYEPAIRAAAGLGRAPSTAGPRPLSAHPRALRRAGRRRRSSGAGGGAGGVGERQARHSCRRAGRDGRRAAARADLHHRRQVGLGLARGYAGYGSRRAATSPCCRARPPSATTTTTTWAWCSGSPITWPTRIPDLPRERLWQVRAR